MTKFMMMLMWALSAAGLPVVECELEAEQAVCMAPPPPQEAEATRGVRLSEVPDKGFISNGF